MYQTARRTNAYTQRLGLFYRDTPKAVFAALAFAYAAGSNPEQDSDLTIASLLAQWQALTDQGVLPQKAPHSKNGDGPHWRRVRTHV